MASEFQLSILTPEKTVFEGPVEYVQVPGTEGYLGVLAHHAALVTGLAKGNHPVRTPKLNDPSTAAERAVEERRLAARGEKLRVILDAAPGVRVESPSGFS